MASLGQVIFFMMITLTVVFSALIILIVSLSLSGRLLLVQSLNRLPVANLDQDHMLSCFLTVDSEQSLLQDVSVTWTKESLTGIIYSYEDGAESNDEQDSQYSGRVQIFSDMVIKGNASLLLRKVRRTDAGEYACLLSHSGGTGKVNIILRTAAEATRWFPKPNVTWLDASNNVLQGSTDVQQSSAGIFRVASTLQLVNVSDTYTCRIQNDLVAAHSDATVTTGQFRRKWDMLYFGAFLSPARTLIFPYVFYFAGSSVTNETYFTYNAASALRAPDFIIIICVFCVHLL
ncbi:V-set domain-containing T-cell activation inhibitor 1 isoform X2 [Syngnathus scovelli]|uniref:V-set domain-containing T-cell activation inhibitor 1 isoform X2 n=1 Tax=Syngnathus scovelli TaxID=161590 RepID=UPI00211007DA|nr:V-set domain-containing T-cell activation inhibitor 1 isoform X2 [Syngnathus scovelli]